jgi:hypothetical protein
MVTRMFTVFNNGSVDSGAISYTLGTTEFTKVAGDCTANLAPGGSCTFIVTWSPSAVVGAGARQSFVQAVAATAGFAPGTAIVNGFAQAAPVISLFDGATPFTTPVGATYAFNNVATGTTSDFTFIVRNTVASSSDTGIPTATPVAFTGAGAGRFSFQSMTCSTSRGLTALDGTAGSGTDECRITIRYAPTVVGSNMATATVSFGTQTAAFTVSGSGVLNATLGINVTTAQNCTGTTAQQALSTPRQCTGGTWSDYVISNGGDVDFSTPLTISVTGAFQQGGVVAGPDVACVNGITILGGGDSCTVRIQHLPDDLMADTGTLTVRATPPSRPEETVTATINATSRSALEGMGTVGFGTVAVTGSSGPQVFTYTYNPVASSASRVITWRFDTATSPASIDYDVVSDTCSGVTLSAGDTCTIGVQFRPSATGVRTGTLIVDDGRDFVRSTLTLTGTGS